MYEKFIGKEIKKKGISFLKYVPFHINVWKKREKTSISNQQLGRYNRRLLYLLRLKRPNNGFLCRVWMGLVVEVVALSSLLLWRHPKHTVQPPTRRSMTETKDNQKPGPVFVVIPAPSLSNSTLMSAKSAISTANAIRLNNAAKNAINEEIMPITALDENRAKKNAKNVAMVATGWIASPRVHVASTTAVLAPFVIEMVYPWSVLKQVRSFCES